MSIRLNILMSKLIPASSLTFMTFLWFPASIPFPIILELHIPELSEIKLLFSRERLYSWLKSPLSSSSSVSDSFKLTKNSSCNDVIVFKMFGNRKYISVSNLSFSFAYGFNKFMISYLLIIV